MMKTSTSISNSRSIIRNTFYIQLAAFILLSLSSSVGSMVDGVVIGQFLGVDADDRPDAEALGELELLTQLRRVLDIDRANAIGRHAV